MLRFSAARVAPLVRTVAAAQRPSTRRRMSMDLDALLSKNRYGGESQKPSIDQIMAANKYGGKDAGETVIRNIAPEYPSDIDIGPLFCRTANRCFLDSGGLCGAYQSGNRNKGMLQDLYTACKETGFFFVYNTRVEDSEIQRIYDHTLRFHTSDDQFKEPIKADKRDYLTSGWIPIKSDTAFASTGLASRASWHLTPPDLGDAPWQQRQWPPAQIVGDDFQKDMTAFYAQMDLMGTQLSLAFAKMLGLDADHFQKLRSPKSLSLLQFSYYPPQKKVMSKDTFGAQTDGVLFSIINQNCPGLQIQDNQGRWCNVRCSSERFIVLIGDALEIISGGEIKATRHRNIASPNDRAMITFRAGLDPEAVIETHELYDTGSGDFKPRTQLEHFQLRREKLSKELPEEMAL